MDQQTKNQKNKLLGLVNEAISLQSRVMDTLTEIESLTGKIYGNLDSLVTQYPSDAEEPYKGLSLKELDEFLGQLEPE